MQNYLLQAANENEDLLENPSYTLRVTFPPVVPSSGRNPDVVAYFVKPGEVTEDLGRSAMELGGRRWPEGARRPQSEDWAGHSG